MAKMMVSVKNPICDIQLECNYHYDDTMKKFRDVCGDEKYILERGLLMEACHELISTAVDAYGSFDDAVEFIKQTEKIFPNTPGNTEVTYDIDF